MLSQRPALGSVTYLLQLMFLAISEVTKVDRQSVHDFIKYDSLKNVVSCCNIEVLSAQLCQKIQTLIAGGNNRLNMLTEVYILPNYYS